MKIRHFALLTAVVFCSQAIAQQAPSNPAQKTSRASAASDPDGTEIDIYPILLWMPSYGLDLGLPPLPAVPGNPSLPAVDLSGKFDSNFGGAYAGGFDIRKAAWIVSMDGLWGQETISGTTNAKATADLTAVYFHAAVGHRIYKDFYLTGGVRYISADIKLKLAGYPDFVRNPGVWDPLVGLAYRHSFGEKFKIKANFDGGGFGVGSDLDLGASVRADWIFSKHFGMNFGYGWVKTEITDTVASKTLTVKQTLSGPIVGIGLYF